MPSSWSPLLGALVAAAVIFAAAATVAIGALAGLGLWLVALVGGSVLGAVAMLTAVGISAASRGGLGLAHESVVDPVTGLPNSYKLDADLGDALTNDVSDRKLTVCILQGMKRYNDAYGDASGDALLAWLGRKLRDAVGDSGTAYRLRGGSFAVLDSDAREPDIDVPGAAAEALLEVGEGFTISCAVGEVALGSEAVSPEVAVELATRRAQSHRGASHAELELRPAEDPVETVRLARPRYDVATLAARVGRRLNIPATQLDDLEAAAQLRDVGNMAIPSAVLTRAGELPGHEWAFIRLHTIVGERLLATNFGMERVARLARSSHERWDGAGYPDGIAGEEIPLGSRIVFVCSAFQDMTSERPHREALEAAHALRELDRGAGSQFDPEIVRAFHDEFDVADNLPDMALTPSVRPPLRVLIADDDAAERFLLRRAVEAIGHDCVTVEDGVSAWEAFQRQAPDVVISDWLLPKVKADELCRRIREHPGTPQPYFVMLLAPEDIARRRQGAFAGADEFLTKPFNRGALEALLEAAWRGSALQHKAAG